MTAAAGRRSHVCARSNLGCCRTVTAKSSPCCQPSKGTPSKATRLSAPGLASKAQRGVLQLCVMSPSTYDLRLADAARASG
jgi:hypothetical protein